MINFWTALNSGVPARSSSSKSADSTVESVLFELLERAGTPEFKAVQKLIL